MKTVYRVPHRILRQTFEIFRECGRGQGECQVLWMSAWRSPYEITELAHPKHSSHCQGFAVESGWLNGFWISLAQKELGIRVQVHTHPGAAFHSYTDDSYPIIHTPGFLSLVIPTFGTGQVGLDAAYLTEIGSDGEWCEVPAISRLQIS